MSRIFPLALLALLIACPAPAQAPQAPPVPGAKDMPSVVTGKVIIKEVPESGKPVKVTYIQVQDAKGPEGEKIENVKGAMLKVTGPKVAAVNKYDGKTVETKGVVKDGTTIEVSSVTVKEATKTAAAPSSSPGAQAQTR